MQENPTAIPSPDMEFKLKNEKKVHKRGKVEWSVEMLNGQDFEA